MQIPDGPELASVTAVVQAGVGERRREPGRLGSVCEKPGCFWPHSAQTLGSQWACGLWSGIAESPGTQGLPSSGFFLLHLPGAPCAGKGSRAGYRHQADFTEAGGLLPALSSVLRGTGSHAPKPGFRRSFLCLASLAASRGRASVAGVALGRVPPAPSAGPWAA